jgi:hypothetical protein
MCQSVEIFGVTIMPMGDLSEADLCPWILLQQSRQLENIEAKLFTTPVEFHPYTWSFVFLEHVNSTFIGERVKESFYAMSLEDKHAVHLQR